MLEVLLPWLADDCEEDCADVEVDEGVGEEDCVEVTEDEEAGGTVDVTVVVDGVNRFVLTTIFEKSKTGGKVGSIGPGPITGGLLTFPLDDWDDDPDWFDCWDIIGVADEEEAEGVYFEVGGELVEVEPDGVFVLDEDDESVFLTDEISLLFVFYGLTVNCLFGTVLGKLFFPLSVGNALFWSVLWLFFVLLLLAEFKVVCPDEIGLETVVEEDELGFCVWEMVGIFVVDAVVSLLTGV